MQKSPKALLITRLATGIGGAERYTETLATFLINDGIYPVVLTNNREFGELLKKRHIQTYLVHWYKEPVERSEKALSLLLLPFYSIKLLFWIIYCRIRWHIDLIYNGSLTDKYYCAIPAAFLHIPTVWIEHGPPSEGIKNKYIKFVYNFFIQFPRYIIAVSNDTKQDIHRLLGRNEKVITIHNGINIRAFNAQGKADTLLTKKEFGIPAGFVVGYGARLTKEKGIDTFLALAGDPVFTTLPIIFVISGKGTDEIQTKIKNHPLLHKKIFFLGFTLDMFRVYNIFDAYILPSHSEGLSLGIVEALLCCIPVVSSKISSIEEIISDGYNGILCRPADIQAFKEALLKLYTDKKYYQMIRSHTRESVEKEFSSEHMYKQTLAVFTNAVN